MNDLVNLYFQWPVLPFSVLLCFIMGYWLLVILGGLDMDVLDIDLDLDADINASVTDLGLLGLKWLNLGEVPFMVWFSLVVLTSWLVTMIFDRGMENPTLQDHAIAIARSLGIGIFTAKILTNPLRGKLRFKEPHTVSDMLGRTCSVVSSEVTTQFGIAVCQVEDGAPLRLNVRTLEGSIVKDAIVQIIDFAPETGLYYVKATGESRV